MEIPGKVALITGATGFVGRRTAQRLALEGMHVRGLVRRPVDLPGLEPYLGDITDAATVVPVAVGAHVVVHCAAVLHRATREEAMRVNVEGTRIVLEAALQAGCARFIHLSTVSVHAVDGYDVVDEATPLRQAGDVYGESKALAEQAVWAVAAKGLPVTVLRPPAILGMAPTAYWSVRMAYLIATGDFALPGDGLATLPYVHVDNLIDAILLALRSDTAVGQAYNIIDGQTTWRAHTDHFRRWLGVGPLPSMPLEAVPPNYRWRGRCSGEKAIRNLGYVPRVTYAEAMAEAERYLWESGLIKG
jgi:nucleoside-diphosphate-sugar epimerase